MPLAIVIGSLALDALRREVMLRYREDCVCHRDRRIRAFDPVASTPAVAVVAVLDPGPFHEARGDAARDGDANILAQQGDRTVESASPSAAAVPGGPTNEVYHFTAAAPGTTALEMSLKRPFGSGDPARTIHVTINVH